MRTPSIAVVLIAVLTGCPSDGTGPVDSAATALGILVQPAATAASGVALTQQPAVQLRDAQGLPVSRSGVLVTASLAVGTGTLQGTAGVRTDAEGKAAWTDLAIAGAAGPRSLRFDAAGLAGIVASPTQLGAGAAAALAYVAGNTQVAAAGTAPAILPKVLVTDAFGNPVAGASVTFEVAQGGGALAGGIAVSAADGSASPGSWTLGPVVGLNALTAYLTSAPGTVITFTATGIVGPAATLEVVEGNNQTATIGTAVPTPPGVKVTDAFGNPVSGVAVTFTPDAGSGSVTGGTATSNASGIARVTRWTLGFTPGANVLTVSRSGVPTVTVAATGASLIMDALSAGASTTCGVLPGGAGRCWGGNGQGQMGDGTAAPQSTPVAIAGAHLFAKVGVGSTHSCGLDTSGAAWCWGENSNGQLGDGTSIPKLFPTLVQDGHVFTQLEVSGIHTCGLRVDGIVLCWGSNTNGRLGDGTTVARFVPTPVANGVYTSISSGNGSHTCGLQADQSLWCWGFNGSGRLGDGTMIDRTVPTLVSGGFQWTSVAVAGAHTCAVAVGDVPYCWGTGGQGQLGTGSGTDRTIPTPVADGHRFVQMSGGTAHSCGLRTDGSVWCFGAGGFGQLGNGGAVDRINPVKVSGDLLWQGVDAGGEHTCGLTTDGSALCWGRNQFGQLGDGAAAGSRTTPVAVKPVIP